MSRLLVLALAFSGMAGCGRASPEELAYLDHQRSLHALADEALAGGRVGEAHTALSTAAHLNPPPAMPRAEVATLRQDAFSRLSSLELSMGRADEARVQAQHGLDLGTRQDIFTAGLLVARGRAEEALDHDSEAVADYHAAQVIDEALLAAERADGGEP